jgi:hypothetical protein
MSEKGKVPDKYQGCMLAVEPLEFCFFLWETSGWRVLCVLEQCHGKLTSCLSTKAPVISFSPLLRYNSRVTVVTNIFLNKLLQHFSFRSNNCLYSVTKHILTEWGTATKSIESTTELCLIIMQLSEYFEGRSCELLQQEALYCHIIFFCSWIFSAM